MAIDIDQSFYNGGTASVETGGTVVSGLNTLWIGATRAGDIFGTHIGGGVRILSVDSNTQLTLAHPWPAAAQASAPYEIQFTPYDAGYQASVRKLLTRLSNGNLDALAALAGAADMVPIFTGPGVMTLVSTDLLGGGSGGAWVATVGLLSGRDVFDGKPADFRVLVIDNGTGRSAVYEKTGDGAADWSDSVYFTGPVGAQGNAATVSIGQVATGPAGSFAEVENSGTVHNAVLNFTLPEGDIGRTGPANQLSIGTVVSGDNAAASLDGDAPNQTLNLTLPSGDQGIPGNAATIAIGTVSTGAAGTEVVVTNTGTSAAAVFDITIPRGADGLGTGDMEASDYDPNGRKLDVYDMDSMQEGEQGLILTPDERQDIANVKRDLHTHGNKQILDDTSESFTTPLKNKLEALPANADKTNTASVGAALAGPTPSTDLVDGDKIGGIGSGGAALKTWSWATIKAGIKGLTDTLYASKGQGEKADTAVQPAALDTALAAKLDKTAQAADSAQLGGKTATTWQAELDAKAGLYTGSVQDELNFPIGHSIVCWDGTANRNATGSPRLHSNGITYTLSGTASQLTGVWRARGNAANSANPAIFMQRVA